MDTTWVFKTKKDAEGHIERLNARLIACGNEQEFGVNYGIAFAAKIDMTSVKLILVLARKWRVPAKHGDVPNAYVKAEKGDELAGKVIPEEIKNRLEVADDEDLVLELKKALYGLNQAGYLWSKLLHRMYVEIGFEQSLTLLQKTWRW
ncbi:hypothetical protein PI124_g16096 [Phytophthora idaei]|nr:hypothetical protein PI125_g15246 [Phytophthora idaei]KAG3144469.1 hypothetical protein PI126_g14153 [Phytophthora idaei]KAG3238952.1 hypothetical protein PI124_g16096 [Phytophthora idaei]